MQVAVLSKVLVGFCTCRCVCYAHVYAALFRLYKRNSVARGSLLISRVATRHVDRPIVMSWEGDHEVLGALEDISSQRPPVSATKIRAAAAMAYKNIREYKQVVYAIERFIRKKGPEYRLAGEEREHPKHAAASVQSLTHDSLHRDLRHRCHLQEGSSSVD